MSQREQAADGRTESLEVLVNGTPMDMSVHLTSVNDDIDIQIRKRMPSGYIGVIATPDVQGCTLSFTVADVTPDMLAVRASYAAAVEAKRIQPITAIRTVFYPSTGARQVMTYTDGVFQSFPRSGGTTGQDSTFNVSLFFGHQPRVEAA